MTATVIEFERAYEAALRRQRELHGAAPSTVDAVVYELRTHGAAQLATTACLHRLAELSPNQMRDVAARLTRLRPQYPAISDELLAALNPLVMPCN